jgi:hypothetical protein
MKPATDDKYVIAERRFYEIYGEDADAPSREHSIIEGDVVTLCADEDQRTLAMFVVESENAVLVRKDKDLPPDYKIPKVLDLGMMPPDDPFFSRGWIFGGQRLSDMAPDGEQEEADRSRGDDGGRRPLCADPEDYDLG